MANETKNTPESWTDKQLQENESGQLVLSDEFPNIKIESSMKAEFDKVMHSVKESAKTNDSLAMFVAKVGQLDGYTIYDGSQGERCAAKHSPYDRAIYISKSAFKEFGGNAEFNTSEGTKADATFARAVVHELAHATKLHSGTEEKNELGLKLVEISHKLRRSVGDDNVDKDLQRARNGGIPENTVSRMTTPAAGDAQKEALAVLVENYVINHIIIEGKQEMTKRLNVGDKPWQPENPRNADHWHQGNNEPGYPMSGGCINGKPFEPPRQTTGAINSENKSNLLTREQQNMVVGKQLSMLQPTQIDKLLPEQRAMLDLYNNASQQVQQEKGSELT